VFGADAAIGLGQSIRAGLVRLIRHDHRETRASEAVAQELMIDSEIQREFGRLARDAFGYPADERLALDHMQQLAREAGGFEPAGDDDCSLRHVA
jgi:hypothetical protein